MESPSIRKIAAESLLFLFLLHGLIFLKSSEFIDTDTYAHLVRLQEMTDQGSVYASTVSRLNTPFGMDFHWTLPFDIFTLVFLAPFALLTGWAKAIPAFAGWVGPATHVLAVVSTLWAFKALFKGWILRVIVFGVVLGGLNIAYGSYGRVDHHVFMAAAWVFLLGFVIRFVRDENRLGSGIGTGILAAFCLWVSPEIFPAVIWAIGAMAAAWSLSPAQTFSGVKGFLLSFLLSAAIILVIDPPPAGITALDFARFSWAHLVFAATVSLAWSAALMVTRQEARPLRRFFILMILLGLGIALYAGLFFQAIKMDKTLMAAKLLSYGVNEYRSPFHNKLLSDGWIIAGRIVLGWFAAVLLAWKDRKQSWNWACFGFLILISGYTLLALRHLRFGVYTEILAIIPLAVLGWRALVFLKRFPHPLSRYVDLVIFLTLLIGPSAIGLMLLPFEKQKHHLDQYEKQFSAYPALLEEMKRKLGGRDADCNLNDIIPSLNDERFIEKSKRIGTEIAYVPELLYGTSHHFIAGPYGDYEALRDAIDFMYLKPVNTAKDITSKRGIDYVLICPFDYGWYEPPHPDSLYMHAAKNKPVSWLDEVAWPKNVKTNFRFWRVLK